MRGRLSSNRMETEAKEDPRRSGTYIRTLVKHLSPKHTPTETQPQQHKKHVRGRPHNSKPYQERLLNMAEARREIVTALKFHRASMKQQEANNHDLQEKRSDTMSNHNLYPPTTTATTLTTNTTCWPMSAFVPPPPPPPLRLSYDENNNIILPGQTLGLNLNFQNFSNLDTNIYQKPLSIDSPSSSSGKPNSSGDLHHAMDDNEMEEIRSLGEQHQIEWNDTINLMTSARWCNFLNTMKIEVDGFDQFDQIMEFPPWLINANESSCLQKHFDDHISDAYFQDPALPCMDIGEIETMDEEWLA